VDKEKIRSIIESLLFISGEPLSFERIAQVVQGADKKDLRAIMTELAEEYEKQGRGIRVVEVAGGYQFETAKENAEYMSRLVRTRPIRLTKPSLETIAIIAYRQPVTRQEVDQIRGVDTSGVIKTLLEYGFIQVMGRKDVPGRPLIYGTSKRFLEFFRLNSLADLPSLDEFFAQAESQSGEDHNLFTDRYQETPGEQADAFTASPEAAAAASAVSEPARETGEPSGPACESPGEESPAAKPDSSSEEFPE